MTTARDIVKSAMQKIGALRKGESPSGDEAADGLLALNRMLSSWSNDSLLLYARTRENFSLVAGTASYTIGTSMTFNTTKPMNIVSAFVRTGTTDYPLTIIPDENYQAIVDKSAQGTPEVLNFSNGHPTATIYLSPVPNAADSLYLMSEKQLSSLSTLDSSVDLPAGWEEAMIYNLGLRLISEYGGSMDEDGREIARDSLASIRRNQIKNRPLTLLEDLSNRSNIYSGIA
jgi:hypothetical protein